VNVATALYIFRDVEAFAQCAKVEASLMAGRTQEALAWCSENKQTLKKMNVSGSVPDPDRSSLLCSPF